MTNQKKYSSTRTGSTYAFICGLVFLMVMNFNGVSAQNAYTKLCNEGFEFEKSGNLDGAIGKYTDAVILNPKAWEAYSYRAKANFRKQKYDESITDISQAITLSPATVSLYEVRAEAYSAKSVWDKAIEDYNMVISKSEKKDPRLNSLHFKRGQLYYWSEKHEQAISDFNQAIQIATVNKQDAAMIYSFRGTAYYKLGRYSEAIKDIDQYLAAGKVDAGSLMFQGLSFMKTNDTGRAKANAQRMVDMDPSKEIYFSGDHLLEIYDLEMRRKVVKQTLDEAHAIMEEEKSLTSKSLANIKLTEAFEKLNKAWYYSPELDQADRDLKNSIRADLFTVHAKMKPKPELPESARKYMVQANSATGEKKYPVAISLWNKVLAIAPWYPTAYFNKALLNEFMGDFQSSIENMNKYLELYPDAEDARAARDKIYEWEGKIRTQPVSPVASSELMQNSVKPYTAPKPKFFMRGGLSMPTGNSMESPDMMTPPTTAEGWEEIFYEEGTIGLQQGYFVEAGLDLNLSMKQSKVRFYYNPIIAGFSQNALDWSSLGGIFESEEIYKKPVTFIEIAQRYGISAEPVEKLIIAAFYRPAFLIPLNFEISQEGATTFSIIGEMSSEKVFNLSHAFGFSIGYSIFSLSYEAYMAKPGYDISIDITGLPSYDIIGRIPMKMNRIGFALSF